MTLSVCAVVLAFWAASMSAQTDRPNTSAQTKKPNILVIMGDDIGWYNTSIYNRGDMGYQTPNIDRIGKEGSLFLAWYGQQSCTAGPRRIHHRTVSYPHRPDKGGPARRRCGPQRQGPIHRRAS
jgi:hypothetical protein